MKADITRVTFDPDKHYSRVLMQQGRVQLDADWNEQSAILQHHLRVLTRDMVGPYAGPVDDCGFEIITAATLYRLASITDSTRRSYLEGAVRKGNFVIGPGRYYVDGIPIENKRAILYTEQPGYPFWNSPTLEDIQSEVAVLIYVDVWERHITYVEDDHLREVALEGPDTCTRAQVVWQIKVHAETTGEARAGTFGCHSADTLPRLGTGMLRARALLDKPVTELCSIPPSSRYRGAENQLYRVEIHQGGSAATGATYKWSRENGSVTFPIRDLSDGAATLETLGRDDHLGLEADDWVEIMDDQVALSGRPGLLAQVKEVHRDELQVTLSVPGSPPPTIPSYGQVQAWLHPLLRRWDQTGDPAAAGALPVVEGTAPSSSAGGWQSLEDGVQIRFSPGGQYTTGDYWLIPARVATGDVEWPHEVDQASHTIVTDADGNPVPAARLAAGTYHSYAPLWLVRPAGGGYAAGHDCRCQFGPLPCVSYVYAYGAEAIGQDLVSIAPKPVKAKRGTKK